MGHLALLAAAGALALFGWGWLDDFISYIVGVFDRGEPTAELIDEPSVSPSPSDMQATVSPGVETDTLDDELGDLDAELNRILDEGTQELGELEEGF